MKLPVIPCSNARVFNLGVEHLNLKGLELLPVPNLARPDVVIFMIAQYLFCQLVSQTTGAHEPADVLDRGHAVQPCHMKPAFRVNLNNNSAVALELNRAVIEKVFLCLSIVMTCNRFAIKIPCHCNFPFSFNFVPLDNCMLTYRVQSVNRYI